MSEPVEESARHCVICGKPQDAALRPFCSRRCADIDLGRWLKGAYIVPRREADEGGQPTSDTGENED
jgi:endogenous inhibitor of DNA gyrase (YacG/DUF329 family)